MLGALPIPCLTVTDSDPGFISTGLSSCFLFLNLSLSTAHFPPYPSTMSSTNEKDNENDKIEQQQDAELGGPEARKKLEKRFLLKLDLRMSIMVVIYILNYVCPFLTIVDVLDQVMLCRLIAIMRGTLLGVI